MVLDQSIKVEKTGAVDIRLQVSGQGLLILDTVQVIPVATPA